MFAPEADNNFRHSEEEALCPEFEKLALVLECVPVGLDGCRGFQLDPVDGLVGGRGFGVPDW